jgi:hypothetical protein
VIQFHGILFLNPRVWTEGRKQPLVAPIVQQKLSEAFDRLMRTGSTEYLPIWTTRVAVPDETFYRWSVATKASPDPIHNAIRKMK